MRPAAGRRYAAGLAEAEVEVASGVHGHERRNLRSVTNQGLGDELELRLVQEREVGFLIEVVVATARVDDLARAGRAHFVDSGQRGGGRAASDAAASAAVLY